MKRKMSLSESKSFQRSRVDEMCRQQIYFLTVEPDDFDELLNPPPKLPNNDNADRNSSNSSSNKTTVSSTSNEEEKDKDKKKRPFQFSDFADQPIRPESPIVSEADSGENPASAEPNDANEGGHEAEAKEAKDKVPDDLEKNPESHRQLVRRSTTTNSEEEVFRVATQTEFDSM